LDVLLTSVQPIRWTRQTLAFGITVAIAVSAAPISPGQSSQHFTFSA
jgi:hypothetical protein